MATIKWTDFVYKFYVQNDYWTDEYIKTLVGKGLISLEEYEEAKRLKKEIHNNVD
ncbi:hypothetical protein CHCC15075_1698 [Bacillus licheniformis]|uniref:XkdX family protein n=2 Tax=Bacillaceae TaxID=186817 RepID=UPI000EB6513F|nr:Phage xkdX protein [Bacillus licheniformis]TWL13340.1 hypothetical protein CHCC16874_1863 [Bacillus licheniformis]TWM26234.1 hypothetical protein CHCC15075_1698 [Bacillus licheniformis]